VQSENKGLLDTFKHMVNLASYGLGARPVSATDAFFAPLERLLHDKEPIFVPDKYDDHGKWMDGWETRRRRDSGHDVAVIKLAVRGEIAGFEIDTAFFTGNYAPACRIEACDAEEDSLDQAKWVEILPMRPLQGDEKHVFTCVNPGNWTHLRFHIYPDGGVARLRVYGTPHFDPAHFQGQDIDLVSSLHGGWIVAFSDAHYGSYHRLLAPEPGQNMGDGWETKRRREPGNEWIIVALGQRGLLKKALIDTKFFKGNYPDRCSLQAADLGDLSSELEQAVVASSMFWPVLMAEQPLSPDAEHIFETQLQDIGPVTHVRLNVIPDGGVSRLRLFGQIAEKD